MRRLSNEVLFCPSMILRGARLARRLDDVDIEERARRGEERHLVALRRDRGAGVVVAAVLVGDERLRDLVQILARGDLGEVDGFERVVPPLREVVEVEPRRAFERAVDGAADAEALEDLGDLLAAVLRGDVVPHALPAPVREVAREPVDGREVVVHDGVADVHVGVRVPPERGVLGEALVEPQRDLEPDAVLDDRLDRPAVEHVVDDGVDELVVDHAPEVPVVAGEGDGDAVLEQLRHPADALGIDGQIDGVRDGEVVVALVDEERDPVGDLVAEEVLDLRVGVLGGLRGEVGEGAAAGLVVVDVEVRGLEVLPVERLVLHLVLPEAEVLRRRLARHAEPRDERGDEQQSEATSRAHGGVGGRLRR